MHFQFLIEDQSSSALIKVLMEKFKTYDDSFTYDCKSFKGIGGFTPKNTIKETKTGKLLNDLATYLRGFNKSLQYIEAAIIVVLDNDDNNTEQFREKLEEVATQNMIFVDHVFCIAVEEVEAWLLGDEDAIKQAYPSYKVQILHSYIQDSICGTWETLADIVFPGGIAKIKREQYSYMEVGKLKTEWANSIGKYMVLEENTSPSFNHFFNVIKTRLSVS